jgi:F-type H+-transporting ATPase subunit alpha
MDDVPVQQVGKFEDALQAHFANNLGDVISKIDQTGDWNDELENAFKKGIEEFKKTGTW